MLVTTGPAWDTCFVPKVGTGCETCGNNFLPTTVRDRPRSDGLCDRGGGCSSLDQALLDQQRPDAETSTNTGDAGDSTPVGGSADADTGMDAGPVNDAAGLWGLQRGL